MQLPIAEKKTLAEVLSANFKDTNTNLHSRQPAVSELTSPLSVRSKDRWQAVLNDVKELGAKR